MCGKVMAIVFIVVAVLMGLLACALPSDHLSKVILVAKFFDVMLPILGVGALLKYITTCTRKSD